MIFPWQSLLPLATTVLPSMGWKNSRNLATPESPRRPWTGLAHHLVKNACP